MSISYPAILDLKTEGQAFSWGDRETMLYALGIGMGTDPMNADELPFVYESDLKAVPTQATVAAWGAGPMGKTGINYLMVVHGEQSVTFHKPMPTEAAITAEGVTPRSPTPLLPGGEKRRLSFLSRILVP
jgi:hypothetical protein